VAAELHIAGRVFEVFRVFGVFGGFGVFDLKTACSAIS
jgi:hypothetical protein